VALAQGPALRIVDAGPRDLDLEWLVPAIVAGDEVAFARFHDATGGLLFGLLLLILGDTALADKVLFAVYAEVRQHANRFDKNQDNLLTWLITVTHRHALENLCSSGEARQYALSVGLTNSPRSGSRHQFAISKSAHRRLVASTLGNLSPSEQKMIQLAYFSRMTPRAIAMQLGESPDRVKVGLQNGISQLYNLFKN
jgi:RNA polymerase sigma-70 factor (ECF subfamily)